MTFNKKTSEGLQPYLNSEETAKFLSIAKSTLYKLTAAGTIPFYRPSGKLILFKRDELVQWIESNVNLSKQQNHG